MAIDFWAVLGFIRRAAFVYLGYALIMMVLQRGIIYQGRVLPVLRDPSDHIDGLQKIWLETSVGKVESWLLPPLTDTEAPAPVIVFAHGNGEQIGLWPEAFERPRRLGFAVYLVEYPGYGNSEGKPTRNTVGETFQLAYDTLISRPDIDPDRIVYLGRSLGGGAVCDLANIHPPNALVLVSTFSNLESFAKRFGLPGAFILDKYDNQACLQNYAGPVFIAHGRDDFQIPPWHAELNHSIVPDAPLHWMDCGHNNCLGPPWEGLWDELEIFLRQINQ